MPMAADESQLVSHCARYPTINPQLTVLQVPQSVVQLVVVHDSRSHDHVRVAIHVLGQRVHGNVGAQLQWPLEVRGEEGVVHYDNDLERNTRRDEQLTDANSFINFAYSRLLLVGYFADRLDVDDFHQGIGGRLDPHHFRIALDGPLQQIQVTAIHELGHHSHPGRDSAQQTRRSSVQVVSDQHMIPGAEQGYDGGGRSKARGERHAIFTVIQAGQTLLKDVTGGVATPAILKALGRERGRMEDVI